MWFETELGIMAYWAGGRLGCRRRRVGAALDDWVAAVGPR